MAGGSFLTSFGAILTFCLTLTLNPGLSTVSYMTSSEFFCSSESHFKLFCKSPEISPILFSFPFASKNWFAPSAVISQIFCIAAAALSLAGTSLCKNTLKDVPASDPLLNKFDIQAIEVLKSSKLTQTAFATHQPCASAKA